MMLVITAIAVWRLTVMLQKDDGPYDIFHGLRQRFVLDGDDIKDTVFARGYSCFYCLSVWISFIGALYLASNVVEFIIYTLALSGVAILIDSFVE